MLSGQEAVVEDNAKIDRGVTGGESTVLHRPLAVYVRLIGKEPRMPYS